MMLAETLTRVKIADQENEWMVFCVGRGLAWTIVTGRG